MNNPSTVSVKWQENMCFEAEIQGHKIIMDADQNAGGENKGPRPKPFMLSALGGCTGMDIVSILKKMKVDFDDLNIVVTGYQTDEHPKHYYKIHIVYEFTGKNLPLDKIEYAIKLSEEKYCGVGAVYRKTMEVTSEIKLLK